MLLIPWEMVFYATVVAHRSKRIEKGGRFGLHTNINIFTLKFKKKCGNNRCLNTLSTAIPKTPIPGNLHVAGVPQGPLVSAARDTNNALVCVLCVCSCTQQACFHRPTTRASPTNIFDGGIKFLRPCRPGDDPAKQGREKAPTCKNHASRGVRASYLMPATSYSGMESGVCR